MGGGGMLRTVGRAVGAGVGGVQEAFSGNRVKPTRLLSLTCEQAGAASSSSFSRPVSATLNRSASARFSDCDEWVPVEGEVERPFGFAERFVFGPVPSKEEVEDAVSTLQQVLFPVACSPSSEDRLPRSSEDLAIGQVIGSIDLMCKEPSIEATVDWVEPVLHLYNQQMLQLEGCNKVFDAFRMLRMNPSIQRMVVSLSSDKAVWDAVLNNEVVQELREAFYTDENDLPESPDESPDAATRVLRWFLETTKAKMVEFMEKITKLVNELFQTPEKGKRMDAFEDALRSSLLLSVVVLLIVVVARVQRA